MKKRKRGLLLPSIVTLVVCGVAGGLFGDRLESARTADEALENRFDEYTEAVAAARYWSAEPIESENLVYSSISGMLRILDPHTSFLPPSAFSEMQDRQKGSFFGLGILITSRNDQVTVVTPLEGTPASRLGIRAGDIIAFIEGESTEDMTVNDVVSKLKGPKGTKVNIGILRPGIEEPIPMTIERAAIPTNSVTIKQMINPEIGYIRLKDFTYTTAREFDQALSELTEMGMKELILDLRTNPGGLLDAAVSVTDHFVGKNEMIVYHKGRTEGTYQEYRAPGDSRQYDIPVVVMINRESASASEIVAGALQDHDRGLIIGETSWGKGLVQSVYSLQYGAGLALTTSRYFTPSGRNIQRDYSSFYDYYLGEPTDVVETSEDNIFFTGGGRKVFGGGGINPDFAVAPRQPDELMQLLQARSVIFNYAINYVAEHEEIDRKLEISDEMISELASFSEGHGVSTADEILEVVSAEPGDRAFLVRQMKAEIISAAYGYEASYPVRLQGDEQIERAIELMPRAQRLVKEGAAALVAEGVVPGTPGTADPVVANSSRP